MVSNKRVLFFVRSFPVLSQTFVINQVKDLVARGMDVHVLSVNPTIEAEDTLRSIFGSNWREKVSYLKPNKESKMFYVWSLLGLFYSLTSVHRLKLVKIAFSFVKKKNFFLAKEILSIAWLLRNKEINVSVCIAHFGSSGVIFDYFRQAKLLKCSRQFTIFHGYEISRYDELKVWENEYCKLGGVLLPISNHWKEKLISLGVKENSIKVLHMGVNVERFTFNDKSISKPLRVLSVARATEKKGLKYAIEAILDSDLDVEYIIIGDGNQLPKLKSLASAHANGSRIKFKGAQSSDYVAQSLSSSDVFLLPSIRDSNGDKEGIPVSLMEAMSCGVIVLSTYHSGIPELIEDRKTGFLVPEKCADGIQEKLVEIIEHKNLTDIRRRARVKVETEFNAKTLIDDLVKITEMNP
mgnify:FL=1